MPTLLNLPWNTPTPSESSHSNSTETLEDEEEIYPRINEEVLNQLPARLRQNLRSLQQEASARLSKQNNFQHCTQNNHPGSTDQRETRAMSHQNHSDSYPETYLKQEHCPLPEMDEGSSKYLSLRNPDPRGSKAGDGRGNGEEGKDKKKVQFDLPQVEDKDGEQHADAGAEGQAPFQGPAAEEYFDDYPEDHQRSRLEFTSHWTASARFHNVLSGDGSNPYAPYTSALREQAKASGYWAGNVEEEAAGMLETKRKRWLNRFRKFVGLKGGKDKKQ